MATAHLAGEIILFASVSEQITGHWSVEDFVVVSVKKNNFGYEESAEPGNQSVYRAEAAGHISGPGSESHLCSRRDRRK